MTLSSPSSRGSSARVLASVGACLAACLLVAAPRAAHADPIVPTSPLTDGNGRTVGFHTNEPGLYFLFPSSWTLLQGARTPAVRVTQVDSTQNFDLRLVLTPDFGHAAPAVVSVVGQDPDALFFPLPSAITQVSLFLPAALGGIQAQLVPDEQGLSSSVAMYYRLRLDAIQLSIMRQLSRGGLALQGTVSYSYLAPGGGIQVTTAPMTIRFTEPELALSTAPPPDPTAWIGDLLATTQLFVPGAIDGPYSLGGGIAINITNSLVEGHFLPNTWSLSHDGVSVINLSPTTNPNFTGSISFRVPQLGFSILADYRATVSVALDLTFMEVALPQFSLTSVTINGSSSPFYTLLLGQLLRSESVRSKLATSMSEEMQRRILAQTLFGLGGILP